MKIGIIGCGKQAPKHIAGLRTSHDIEIVVYDVNPQASLSLVKECNVEAVTSVESILKDPQVQGVIIATPTPFHFDFIMQSLEANKHVFCEKPLCETIEQAKLLSSASRESHNFVQVGYVYRFVPAFQGLKSLLTSNEKPLGRAITANLRLGGRGSHSLWKHRKDAGGGTINEMLVHMLDLANWLFGEITDISSYEQRLLRPTRIINGEEITADAEDFVLLSGFTASGVYVTLQADLLTPAFRQYVEVQGENGSFIGSIQQDIPASVFLLNSIGDFPAGKKELTFLNTNLFHEQMNDFIRNIRQNTLINSPSIMDSIHLLKILSKIRG